MYSKYFLVFINCVLFICGISFLFADIGNENLLMYGSIEHTELTNTSDSFSYGGASSLNLTLLAHPGFFSKAEANIEMVYFRGYLDQIYGHDNYILCDFKKLYISYWQGPFDFMLGRQYVSLGKATLFSPNDIFTLRSLDVLDKTQTGIDACTLSFALGNFSSVSLVIAPKKEWSNGNYIFTGQGLVGSFDISAHAFYQGDYNDQKYWGLSLDFKGDAFFGVLGEAILRFPVQGGEPNYQVCGGIDFSIGSNIFLNAEYAYVYGESMQLYKQSLGVMFVYTISELFSVQSIFVLNPVNLDFFDTLMVTISVDQDLKLSLYSRHYYTNATATKKNNTLEFGFKITLSF